MKKRTEFKDAFGTDIKLGDFLIGHLVNTELVGEVIALSSNLKDKPFTINTPDGPKYMNSEYCKKLEVLFQCPECGNVYHEDNVVCPTCGHLIPKEN